MELYEEDPFYSEIHEVLDLSEQEISIDSDNNDIILIPLNETILFKSHGALTDYHVLIHFEDQPQLSVAIRQQTFVQMLEHGEYSSYMTSFTTSSFGSSFSDGQPFLFSVGNTTSLMTNNVSYLSLEEPELEIARENYTYGWVKTENSDTVKNGLKFEDLRYELVNSSVSPAVSQKCFDLCVNSRGLCLAFDFNSDSGSCFQIHLNWVFHDNTGTPEDTTEFLLYDERRRSAAHLIEFPNNLTSRSFQSFEGQLAQPMEKYFIYPSYDSFFRIRFEIKIIA